MRTNGEMEGVPHRLFLCRQSRIYAAEFDVPFVLFLSHPREQSRCALATDGDDGGDDVTMEMVKTSTKEREADRGW